MTVQRTLSIIKPDAVAKNVIGQIYSRFEANGLKIVAAKMKHLSIEDASGFYAIHKDRPFFKDLVNFMISGPVLIQVLEGENAVDKHREVMGATNPKDAKPGTIRADFAASIVLIVSTMQKMKSLTSLLLKKYITVHANFIRISINCLR